MAGDDVTDGTTFDELVARHRRELQVHCYRMTGSVDVAEDLVQETFERAWRRMAQFEGRASLRTWLYRIATNACLDHLKRAERRTTAVGSTDELLDLPAGLQPFPDAWLPEHGDPAAGLVARETIELAFIAALQHLPERQRAALIGRDILGWTAAETAAALGVSEAAANSLVQRARRDLRRRTPATRATWSTPELDAADRDIVRRYVDAHERGDAATIVAMLSDGIGITMPPEAPCIGLDAAAAFFHTILATDRPDEWRLVPTAANGRPAAANYRREPDASAFRAISIDVLTIVDGEIATINCFLGPDSFAHVGLPLVWDGPSS